VIESRRWAQVTANEPSPTALTADFDQIAADIGHPILIPYGS
jgi:hypothetical protein